MNGAITKSDSFLFYAFCVSTISLFFVGLKLGIPYLPGIPFSLLLVVWGIADYKSLFIFLLAMLPISIEYYFSSSLATDLPTEPLMIGISIITLLVLFTKIDAVPLKVFKSVPFLLLMLHLFWIFICAVNSENFVYSIKVFLSKLWYILPFSIMPLIIFRGLSDLKKIFWAIYIPLTLAIIITLLRHGIIYKFAFDEVNRSVVPYFRNHVNYAAMVSIFFPWLWLADKWYKKTSTTGMIIQLSKLLYIVAIYLSYTRTCMLALLAMIPFYFIIKWKLMKPALAAGVLVAVLAIGFVLKDNYYLRFAPNYSKTIYHDDFGSHLTSTFEGEDVSSMERVYRWVAAIQMFSDRPWMGVGSGNFYDYYKKYSVSDFETYISDNEERSTVHNYFLLILVEQGGVGLLIFVLLTLALFIQGSSLYQSLPTEESRTVLILSQSLMAVYVNLMLSDMLESDKVGPFFFLIIALFTLFKMKLLEGRKSLN
jgi:O-antigen ligase